MSFTVLGAAGMIGSRLAHSLRGRGIDCFTPARGNETIFTRDLGHVVFCVGLTSDFSGRPFDTVDAHVCSLLPILQRARFTSFLYLSSTRVYARSPTAREDDALPVAAGVPDDLYNISKLMGESLCRSSERPGVRIVRLSNVYGDRPGSDSFLAEVIGQALAEGRVTLRTSPRSSKDYVALADVAPLLIAIARAGRHTVYNVASGVNVTHEAVLTRLAELTGCTLDLDPAAEEVTFPVIPIERVREEFGFVARPLLENLAGLVARVRDSLRTRSRRTGGRTEGRWTS